MWRACVGGCVLCGAVAAPLSTLPESSDAHESCPDKKRTRPKSNVLSLSSMPRFASLVQRKGKAHFRFRLVAARSQRPAHTAARALGTDRTSADLVTNTLVSMAGRVSNTAGNAAGRYNLRPRGRRDQGGLRGAAALADSPLLGRLLRELSDLFDAEVLPLLDPTTRALLGRCGRACRDAVLRSPKLPCAGRTVGVPLRVKEFVGSVGLLTWAKANGCPWGARTCELAGAGGRVEVLKWAREQGCDWGEGTCASAAAGGHLEVLNWAREHGCPWEEDFEDDEDDTAYSMDCCALAAGDGHLKVLKWLRGHHCPWNGRTCAWAALRADT